jgi:hypothetical protein
MGPEAATEAGQAHVQKGRESTAAITQYVADLVQGYVTVPKDNVLSKLVNDKDGPDGPMTPNNNGSWSNAAAEVGAPAGVPRSSD